jgi:hypothetical protein
VTWAPHHSYSPHWLNFGTFADVRHGMLELAKANTEVEFVLRAHPFMFGTLVDREVLTPDELADWQNEWDALANTIDGSEFSLAEVFDCDLMVSDGISFLAEYPLATGRSGMFIEREGHWPFSTMGELAVAANYSTNIAKFADEIQRLLDSLPVETRVTELAALRETAMPSAGKSAQIMKDALLAHWATEPGLVDPSRITETAWELLPGREPLD